MNSFKSKKKILIVDDEESIRKILNSILKKQYSVTDAIDGLHAISILSKFLPDLIITDLNMPHMDGHEFIRSLQKSGLYKNIPIILLTGENPNNIKIEKNRLQIVACIQKPFDSQNLLKEIENLFTLKQRTENITN